MQSVFVASFLFFSLHEAFVRGERATGTEKHLFVQRRGPVRGSSLPVHQVYLTKNKNGSTTTTKSTQNDNHRLPRARRSAREKRSRNSDPIMTMHKFNDTHSMLYVHWTGISNSDTVVVLSRDIRQWKGSKSYLYVSNNYGVNYVNQSHKLSYKNNSATQYGLIERFYSSPTDPTRYIFVDTTHNAIFTSIDDCETFKYVKLLFKPSNIIFHVSKAHGLLAYDESTKTLHYSRDFGSSWRLREDNVKSYSWGIANLDSDDVLYIEKSINDTVSDVIRGHYDHKHYYSKQTVFSGATDFEIQGEYLFATKTSANGLDLYVSYHYHNFEKAEFPKRFSRNEDYFIADASEGQVFVAVNHNINTTHLYRSDHTGKKYFMSLERVLYYNPEHRKDSWIRRYMSDVFIDLHPVASMRGVYLASQVSVGKVGTRAISTVITYDKGKYWSRIRAPTFHADGTVVNCSYWQHCSLHLAQNFAKLHPYYHGPSIKSEKSAPGLIISSGNIGKRLSYWSNVYLSYDAGETWKEILRGRHYFNFADHGGVVVAVKQWSPTKELLYSTDEGVSWKRYNFTNSAIRVYGLLTEPGETTTIFTVFGSYTGRHRWLVVQVNMTNVLGRPCSSSDYETWSPYSSGYGRNCLLGEKMVFERRKRRSTCFNGKDYDRAVSRTSCLCSWADFECDVGFKDFWGFFCVRDYSAGYDPYAPPRPCPPGTFYNKTYGYVKIPGDKCVNGTERWYMPSNASCPFKLDKAFLLYAERDQIHYVNLTNNKHSAKITGLRGAVALAYDIKEGYIYWADMLDHKIMRQTLNETDAPITIAGIKQIEGMDFDWTTGNLYWVDSVEKVIEVCRKDGLFRKTIHSADLDKPRAIALDPPKGEMFWSDWGSTPKIEMSDMDGTNRTVLISTDIHWPNGIAIDIFSPNTSRSFYWTDAYIDKIERVQLPGLNRHTIISKKKLFRIVKHPYSIAVDDKYIYWDDWSTGSLYKMKKSLNEDPIALVTSTSSKRKKKFEVKVYYSRSQKDRSKCSENSCSQLCLPKPLTFNCTCGDDMEVAPGYEKTGKCRCIGGLTMLKNGTCLRKAKQSCTSTEFPCSDGHCIPLGLRCDNKYDCGWKDFSDEEDCPSAGCAKNEFRCPSGLCISMAFMCDQHRQCPDGADERNCTSTTCDKHEFQCKNGQCVFLGRKCDNINDCHDNSDESGCPTAKPACKNPGDFQCDDKSMCVDKSARCNTHRNCPDGSDEAGCVNSCATGYVPCHDYSTCIQNFRICDGHYDCIFDHSDEISCVTPTTRGGTTKITTPTTRGGTTKTPTRGTGGTTKITTPTTRGGTIKTPTGGTGGTAKTPTGGTGGTAKTPTGGTGGTAKINGTHSPRVGAQKSSNSKKTLVWAIPVGVVFGILVVILLYFVVKSRRLQRSLYRLIRSDSLDRGVTYHHNGDEDGLPLIQGFSDDDPLVEA